MKRATLKDIDDSRFRKQPKALDENNYYKELSIQARYLYGIMLDKFKLSKSNNWVNKNGEVYFIFKQKDLAKLMNMSIRSIKRYMEELIKYNLLEKESTMTVNLYYITLEYQQCENMSLRIRISDPTNTQIWPNNSDTNSSDTNFNETDYLLSKNESIENNLINIEDTNYTEVKKIHFLLKQLDHNYIRKRTDKNKIKKYNDILIMYNDNIGENRPLEKLTNGYIEKYKNSNHSIEHFIKTMAGSLEYISGSPEEMFSILEEYEILSR